MTLSEHWIGLLSSLTSYKQIRTFGGGGGGGVGLILMLKSLTGLKSLNILIHRDGCVLDTVGQHSRDI